MRLVEILDDRKRLRKEPSRIFQRRHQRLRVHGPVAGCAVLAFGQVHEGRFVGEALQVESDAHPESG